ncbi:MAG: hypothetical protein KDB53_03440, partial [Planctomycetes bacterium]|nr:hypothetical protein [Planctomycetota bacterium]
GLLALERWRVTGGGHVSTDLLRKIDAALLLASGLRLEVRGEPVIMTSTDPLMLYAHNAGPYTLTLSLEREDGNRHRRQPPLVLKPGARLVKEVRVPAAPFFAMEVAIGDLGSFGLQRYAEWADIDVRGLLPRRGPCWPFDVSETRLGLPRQPIVLPGFRPADLVIPFVGEKAPEVAIDGPFGLASSVTDDELSVRIEANEERAGSGRLRFSAKCVDRRAIDYPHISLAYTGVRNPQLEIKSFPCEVDRSRRVGYLGGTGDFVPEALERLGVTTQMLDDDALRAGAFANLDTLILGVRAYKLRPALAEMHAALMEWVEKGGVLIVQYQKLEMNAGQGASPYGPFPGLRVGHGRVTDETAPIRKLVPDHPVFQQPNLLTDADWEGWVQERGLYFLELSDPRYVDLVETEDPFPFNAGPKRGALVEARHGKGRWCYVGLGLFRQLRAGVPGAWRLLANLVSLTSSSP